MASDLGVADTVGGGKGQPGWPAVDVLEGERDSRVEREKQDLQVGRAEQDPDVGRTAGDGWRPDPRSSAAPRVGPWRLAGRVKRRPDRRGRQRAAPTPYEAVLELDAELCEASKGVAGLRLELGQALGALVNKNAAAELGYSSLHCYALQRCSQTGRWADDARRVAVRLGSLPALRAALVTGEVNWSMAELVSRHATAETDGELVEQAKGLTVRQMRERLGQSARGQGSDEHAAGGRRHDAAKGGRGHEAAEGNQQTDDSVGPAAVEPGDSEFMTAELGDWPPFPYVDEVDPIRTLTITVDRDVAWLFESTRMLAELLVGQSNTDTLLECLLAEALTSLPGERARGCALYEDYAQEQARQRTQLEQQAKWVQEREAACEKNFAALLGFGGARAASNRERDPETNTSARAGRAGEQEAPAAKDEAGSKRSEPRQFGSALELDRSIGELAAGLARWDLHVGMLADKLHQVEGWRRLGFSTETQYARERLGMCASSLRAKRALARRLRTLPRVREAVEQGAIGFDAAVQIGKVATERTEKLWLERAKRRTAKHLREEVELCELVMRRIGRRFGRSQCA
jgi:hypothetical protein